MNPLLQTKITRCTQMNLRCYFSYTLWGANLLNINLFILHNPVKGFICVSDLRNFIFPLSITNLKYMNVTVCKKMCKHACFSCCTVNTKVVTPNFVGNLSEQLPGLVLRLKVWVN